MEVSDRTIFISCLYRPPDTRSSEFLELINFMRTKFTDDFTSVNHIMLGDFNFPNINWGTSSCPNGFYGNSQVSNLLDFADENFMNQHIYEPTRGNNILDLIFSNNDDIIFDIQLSETIISDHKLLDIVTDLHIVNPDDDALISDPFKDIDLNSTKFPEVNKTLDGTDWDSAVSSKNLDQFLEFILDNVYENVSKFSERILPKSKKSYEFRKRRKLLRKRRKFVKKNNLRQNSHLESKISNLDLEIKESISRERETNEIKAVEKIKSNPKSFFTYAKKNKTLNRSIAYLKNSSNEHVSDRVEICNTLQETYCSSFSVPKDIPPIDIEFNPVDSNIFVNFEFSVNDIKRAIDEIPNNSSSGPDNISVKVLKKCRDSIAYPLFLLWSKSLALGVIPVKCKQSNIVPIHKKGKKDDPNNYRPVSLTSHLIKIFERVMKNYFSS